MESLKILEWKFNQNLGESISMDDFKENQENESFLLTNMKYSDDGSHLVVSDKGGRVIIFKNKKPRREESTKLEYLREFQSQIPEYDILKTVNYDESVRALDIWPTSSSENLSIITAGFRNIKVEKFVFSRKKKFVKDQFEALSVPKVRESSYCFKNVTKHNIKSLHEKEINSVSINKVNNNQFLSSDAESVVLWDVDHINNPWNLVNINIEDEISKTHFSQINPSIFLIGTVNGGIYHCDLRVSSDILGNSQKFIEDNRYGEHTIFHPNIVATHDVCFFPDNEYTFASRHLLNVNLWDIRVNKEPTSKLMLYEPLIQQLSRCYQKTNLQDRFNLSCSKDGNYLVTGGYDNMCHIIDVKNRLNTQLTIDPEKPNNLNLIRKFNSKGNCNYKQDLYKDIKYKRKITNVAYSPIENISVMGVMNCVYSYKGRFNNYTYKSK